MNGKGSEGEECGEEEGEGEHFIIIGRKDGRS